MLYTLGLIIRAIGSYCRLCVKKKSTPTCIAEASFCVCCSMIEETLGLKFVYSVMYRPTNIAANNE